MGGKDIINEVLTLKRERKAVILAHNYMNHDVQVVADFIGDSYDLALKAMETNAEVIVFAGVRFMAEQAKPLTMTGLCLRQTPPTPVARSPMPST